MRHTLMFKICIILAIVSVLFILGGAILLGCIDLMGPFNVIPLGAVMLVLGLFGALGFTIGAGVTSEDRRWR